MKQFENILYYYLFVRINYVYLLKLKVMIIELSVSELNDLYYCLGKVRDMKDKMIENDEVDRLMDVMRDGIMSEIYNEDELV